MKVLGLLAQCQQIILRPDEGFPAHLVQRLQQLDAAKYNFLFPNGPDAQGRFRIDIDRVQPEALRVHVQGLGPLEVRWLRLIVVTKTETKTPRISHPNDTHFTQEHEFPGLTNATPLRRRRFVELLRGLLTLDPEQRMTAEEALDHAFFKH